MNRREKILAAGAAVVVVTLFLIWMINSVSSAFDSRYEKIAKLQSELSKKQDVVVKGKLASAKLKAWERRSLSSDVTRAQSDYREWLHASTVKAGLEAKPTNEQRKGDLYVEHQFLVTGHTEVGRLIQFLHDFYSAGYLHSIHSFNANIKPETLAMAKSDGGAKSKPGKKELDVNFRIGVLSLNKAPADVDGKPPAADPPLAKDVATYTSEILRRNVFSPLNNPPKIASIGPQRGNPRKSLSVDIKGKVSDPDKLDSHTFSLVSELEGARINEKSGELSWTPPKLGKYEAVVRVTDDGFPPKTAEETVKFDIVEAPKPPSPWEKDDPARDATVSGIVGTADQLQVWVKVPRGLGDQAKTLHLNAGDSISVGSFVGVVKQVRLVEAEFELKDGRKIIVKQGQALVPKEEVAGSL